MAYGEKRDFFSVGNHPENPPPGTPVWLDGAILTRYVQPRASSLGLLVAMKNRHLYMGYYVKDH